MENIGVDMSREHMNDIPQYLFPQGFSIRNYRRGEGYIWTRIAQATETFFHIDDKRFNQHFQQDSKVLNDRIFFVITDEGEEIGTITAWSLTHEGKEWGQIDWVFIHPDYQGRGLCKPMMTAAMERIKRSHDCCRVGTSTGRIVAIKVYL